MIEVNHVNGVAVVNNTLQARQLPAFALKPTLFTFQLAAPLQRAFGGCKPWVRSALAGC
jgi:hypothetical protein